MKKIFCLLLLVALLMPGLPPAGASDLAPEGFTLMAESEALALYLREKDMLLQVTHKATGRFIQSSLMEGQQGNQVVKNLQKSMFNVTFIVNAKSGTVSAMDSHSMGVMMGGVTAEQTAGGLRLHFTVGDTKLTEDDLPKMIPLEKYNALLKPHFSEKNDKTFRGTYVLVGGNQWIRSKDQGMGALAIKQLYALLFETGQYTQEDLIEDNLAFGHERAVFNPRLSLALDFRLDGDDLLVSLPLDSVETTPDNHLTMVEILPYFLSATREDQGYFLVPDGPGGLIPFNSGNTTALSYLDQVYGPDPLKNINRYQSPRSRVQLPVLGMKKNGLSALAIIEEGAEMAELFADISGRADEFNRASIRFVLRDIEAVSLLGNQSITVPRFSDDVYTGSFRVRYKLFFEEDFGYVEMARAYQDYLIKRGMLTSSAPLDTAPVFIETLGAFSKQKFFLGIPYRSTVTAGSLPQIKSIYEALKAKGLGRIHLSVYGLLEGGMKHYSLSSLKLDPNMGGLAEWNRLRDAVTARGDEILPSVYMNTVYGRKRFNYYQDAARLHNGDAASVMVMQESTMLPALMPYQSYYLSPHSLKDYVEKAAQSLSGLSPSALHVRDLGFSLVPDYARRKNISRVHARPGYQEALKELAASFPLALSRPNDYAFPHATYAMNLPTSGNGFKVVETAVPFLPLVLEGCLPGAVSPMNLAAHQNPGVLLLHAMEARFFPAFTLSHAPETVFHDTQDKEFMSFFTTQYEGQLDRIADISQQYEAFYQQVKGARTLSHEVVNQQVRRIRYDNGLTLLINYGSAPYLSPEGTVEGGSYLLTGGQQ